MNFPMNPVTAMEEWGSTKVSIKSLYDDKNVYFLISYKDPTKKNYLVAHFFPTLLPLFFSEMQFYKYCYRALDEKSSNWILFMALSG